MNKTILGMSVGRESSGRRDKARDNDVAAPVVLARIPFDPAVWQWRHGGGRGFEHVLTGQVRADHEFDWESAATVPIIFAPDGWHVPPGRGAS